MNKKAKKITISGIVFSLFFAGASATLEDRDTNTKCGGEERWAQKVVIDDSATEIDTTPKQTTIQAMNETSTSGIQITGKTERQGIEKQVYTIQNCFISKAMIESDNDIHLAIEDGAGHHMVAEIPDPKCAEAKKSDFYKDYKKVRTTFLKYQNVYNHYRFNITGVLFVDKKHPKPPVGNASNNVELHPVIGLTIADKF